MKIKILTFVGLLCFCSTGIASAAENKVVVIPLAGDDTAQQYVNQAGSTGEASEGCNTLFYFTHETKITQVKAIAAGSIRLVNDETQWYATPMYSKNSGAWTLFPESQAVYSGGSAGHYSASTNTKQMSLDPDSNYRFKVDYRLEPQHTISHCSLVLEFSFETSDVINPLIFIPF